MLTLRRKAGHGFATEESTIDIDYKGETVTLSLVSILGTTDHQQVALWRVYATDWGKEKYHPRYISLTDNQPLLINDWLKVYGSKITESGEAVMHLKAPRDAIIQRRDRK